MLHDLLQLVFSLQKCYVQTKIKKESMGNKFPKIKLKHYFRKRIEKDEVINTLIFL